MELSIQTVEKGKQKILRLAGEIDAYTAPKLKNKLLPLTKESGSFIQVDMKLVTYMDSTGLGVFISALKSTKENNSTLKLIYLSDRVYRVFQITGLVEIIDIEHIGKVEINNE